MKYRSTGIATLASAVMLCGLVPASVVASPIVVNGSFEAVAIGAPFFSSSAASIPGWTHGGAAGDALLWAIGYADSFGSVTTAGTGSQFVTLGGGFPVPGTSDWSTTITGLTPGDSYVLNFMTATELGGPGTIEPGGPQTMTVGFLSGSSTGPMSFTSPISAAAYWRTWVTQAYPFTATAGSAVVDFSVSSQPYDMGLDNVSVRVSSDGLAPVPEPASLLLLGTGLAGVVARRRRARL